MSLTDITRAGILISRDAVIENFGVRSRASRYRLYVLRESEKQLYLRSAEVEDAVFVRVSGLAPIDVLFAARVMGRNSSDQALINSGEFNRRPTCS